MHHGGNTAGSANGCLHWELCKRGLCNGALETGSCKRGLCKNTDANEALQDGCLQKGRFELSFNMGSFAKEVFLTGALQRG